MNNDDKEAVVVALSEAGRKMFEEYARRVLDPATDAVERQGNASGPLVFGFMATTLDYVAQHYNADLVISHLEHALEFFQAERDARDATAKAARD